MPNSKILIVDDSPMAMDLIKAILADYELTTAIDGEEGLRLARELSPDLIVLDVMLPKIDGYTICRLLKFDEKYKSIPIIMFSGRAGQADIDKGGQSGANLYLVKPVDKEQLREAVEKFLSKPV